MNSKDADITMFKIVIDDKLFKRLNDENPLCAKDLYYGENNDLYEKYVKICELASDNCGECWKKFITEDLVKIERKES